MLCPDRPAIPKAVIGSVDDSVRRGFCAAFDDGDGDVDEADSDDVVRVLCEIQRAYGPLFPVTDYEGIVVKRETEFMRCFQRYDSDSRRRALDSATSGDASTNPSKQHEITSPHPPSKPCNDNTVTPSRNQIICAINDWSTMTSFESNVCLDKFGSNSATETVDQSTSSDIRHVTLVPDRVARGSAGHCCSIPPFLRPIEEEDSVSNVADDVTTGHGNVDEVTSDEEPFDVASDRCNDEVCLTNMPCFSTGSSTPSQMTSSIALSKPGNTNHSDDITANDVTARTKVLHELSSTGESPKLPREDGYRKSEQTRGQFEFDQTLVLLISVVTFAACLGSVSPCNLVPVVAVTSLFYFLVDYFELFSTSSATDQNCEVFTTDNALSFAQ